MCFRTKSVLTMDCNASTVAVALQATRTRILGSARALAIANFFSAPALNDFFICAISRRAQAQAVSARAAETCSEARALPGSFASQHSPLQCFII